MKPISVNPGIPSARWALPGHEIQILSLVEREGPVKSRFLDHKKVKELSGTYIHPESRLVVRHQINWNRGVVKLTESLAILFVDFMQLACGVASAVG